MRAFVLCALLLFLPEGAQAQQFIYAASSLARPLEQVLEGANSTTHGRPIIIYGASALLARQIKLKARADIFITAHKDWLKQISYQEALPFIHNRLVLVASPLYGNKQTQWLPKNTRQNIKALLLEIKTNKQRFALSTAPVPAGLYARQALKHYNLWQDAAPVSIFSPSAQMTLTWLVQNKARAGIVYKSDIAQYPALKSLWTFPQESHEPIIYYIARLNNKAQTLELWRTLRANKNKFAAFGFGQ